MDLLLIVLCLPLLRPLASAAGLLNRKQGESCKGLNDVEGVCTLLSLCEYPGDVRHDRPPICSFREREPVICCPISLSERIRLAGIKIQTYCSNAEIGCMERRQIHLDQSKDEIVRHVVGGDEAKPKTHIHMALIGYGRGNNIEWGCGGSLINTRFVLSAAHCANPPLLGEAKWVRLGELDTSTHKDDEGIQDRFIVDIFTHPSYKEAEVYHDIALFKVDKPVLFTPWVGPACLYTDEKLRTPNVTVTGWGRVDFSGAISEKLLEAHLDLFSDEDCSMLNPTMDSKTPRGIDSRLMFCAGKRDGSKDACSGDSGGPLVITRFDHCLKTQVGITSYGNQCGLPDSPGVYTRVSQYITWIENVAFSSTSTDGLIFD